jgi:hypothetical protein
MTNKNCGWWFFPRNFVVIFNPKNWEIIGIFLLVLIQLSLLIFWENKKANIFIWKYWTQENPDCDRFILNSRKKIRFF